MRLNIRMKDYVIGPPTDTRHIGEWFYYYNFAAGSFHTKKLCSRLVD